MNRPVYVFNRFLKHLKQGTLAERAIGEWHDHIRQRRIARWHRQKEQKKSFIYPLQKDIQIELYFDSMLCQLIYCDRFEQRERQFIGNYLRPGDIFIDVGANIGLFSLIASRRVGESGMVFAFEPCRKTFERLVRNVELNRMNNVQCFQVALSDRAEQVQMIASQDGYDAWNSLATPHAGHVFVSEMVHAVTWDDFVAEQNLIGRVALMKIDVEGWESRVLDGGLKTLSRKDAPVLQVEFTDAASKAAGTSCQALYHQLAGLGYQMFVYDEKSNRIIPDPLREHYPYINLLATKNPEAIHARLKK